MAQNIEDFEDRISELVPWQQYLRAKWTATLFERFKDIKEVWRIADHGTREERQRVDERLSDIFYEIVAVDLFKYFGDAIIAGYSWDEFTAGVFEIAGLDVDSDFLRSSPEMEKLTPGLREWAKS